MFTTCIHCTADLGRNEAFDAFPVGTRLAFDAAKGRLWVVCRACDRWNLSPLEERWEAVEAMERRFRDSRLRVSTDNVGLARLKEGVDLIRIGEPQRPEMAAWRYGDQFGRRRKRQMLITGTLVGSAVALVGGMAAVGVSVGSFAGIYANGGLWDALVNGRPSVSIGKIVLPDCGKSLMLCPATDSSASSSRSSAMRLSLRQAPFSRGAAQTRPSHPVSCQGTRMEMCFIG